MKLKKIYDEITKAYFKKGSKIIIGDWDDSEIGVTTDGFKMYFLPVDKFIFDVEKLLRGREKINMSAFKEPRDLKEVFKTNEMREIKSMTCVKIDEKWVDTKNLSNFDEPTFKTTDSPYSAIYLYELDEVVGFVMPVKVKEEEE